MRAAKTLVLCLFLVVSFVSAHADNIVFNTNFGGTWSYGGPGGTFTGHASDPATGFININGGVAIPVGDLTVDVLTGPAFATSSTAALFSSTGSSFSISNSTFGTIFSGALDDISLNLAAQGATGPLFQATFISGTFNPVFLAAFGLDSSFVGGTGKTTFNLLGNFNGEAASRGDVNGSVSDLSQVPEPASLALLGSGLLATGGFIRRKLIA